MSASITSALQFLALLSVFVLVVRLLQLKLQSKYPFFFGFLCVPLILQTVTVFYGTGSLAFFYCYVVLQPIRTILYILVVWELFSVIFRNYAGLRSLSRWVMGIAAAIAPLGFAMTFLASGSVYRSTSRVVPAVVRFERGIALGLIVFIIIMLYFISRYPIKLPRNSVVLCMLYSIWFLGDAAILLASSFIADSHDGRRFVNDGGDLLEIGCYIAWTLLLSKAGEYQETRVRRDISPEDEKSLIGELDAMNELLLRAGRSISHSR
jgi:hypothetical protein